MDTAEKPAQENIQGVGIQLVKLNNTKGQKPAVMDTPGTTIGGEDASLPTPRRAALTSARQIM